MGKRSSNLVDVAVGERIRNLRLRNKVTQEELGRRLNVSFQQIQKYEKGTNRVGASRLSEIAAFFNVSVSAFFDDQANSKKSRHSVAELDRLTDPHAVRLIEAFLALDDRKLQIAIVHLTEEMVRSRQV